MAANSMQVSTATMARPPVKPPSRELQKLIRRREMPPPSIRLPATMNRGMASSGKESTEVNIRWAITSIGVAEPPKKMPGKAGQHQHDPNGETHNSRDGKGDKQRSCHSSTSLSSGLLKFLTE